MAKITASSSRSFKKITIIFLAGLILFSIFLITCLWSPLKEYGAIKLQGLLLKTGISWECRPPTGFLNCPELIVASSQFSPITLKDFNISPKISDLLQRNLSAEVSAKIGSEGDLLISAGKSLLANEYSSAIKLNKIDLNLISKFKTLAFDSGELDITANRIALIDQKINGDFQIEIYNLNKTKTSEFNLQHSNFVIPLEIPRVKDGLITASGQIEKSEKVNLKNITIKSNLINGSASGLIEIKNQKIVGAQIDFDFKLTSEALELYGSFLPLISGGKLDNNSKDLKGNFVFNKGLPKVIFQ